MLPTKMPILGVCYGFQFLNVYFGGDLVQNLCDRPLHYNMNWFKAVKGSELNKIIGDDQFTGVCYHHQGLGKSYEFILLLWSKKILQF